MLRRQTQETTEATGWHHTLPDSQARFDKDTTQSVLAAAARLQAADENTLTQTELETVAAEMGIAPRYVRQALHGTRGTQRAQVLGNKTIRLRTTEHLYIPLVYALCLCPFVALEHSQHGYPFQLLQMGMVLVIPFLLSVIAGFRLRNKASAALAGGLNIVALVIGSYAGILMNHRVMFRMSSTIMTVCLVMLLGAVIAGILGAALGQWWITRRSQPQFSPRNAPPALGDR